MKRTIVTIACLTFASAMFAATTTVNVGGESMWSNRTIVNNAINSADHTTLVTALKAADLVTTLQGAGPFTVFAPTNAAFDRLPAGTVKSLLLPENKAELAKILTYHVIAGNYNSAQLANMIKRGHGSASLKTIDGELITFMMNGPRNIVLKDIKGNVANISTYDVMQSNGVIHVIDRVEMP